MWVKLISSLADWSSSQVYQAAKAVEEKLQLLFYFQLSILQILQYA